ncbi:MAG: hypothetical protein MUF02_09885 [Acidobacteria bacterium]|jgi:hypothetical protein|nr:hypothetical protein [Acidobacteriota bacterium]
MNAFNYRFSVVKRFFGISVFPTWITVRIGTHKSYESLLAELKNRGFSFSDEANYLADRLGPMRALDNQIPVDIDLVACELPRLGIERGTPLEVRKRGRRLGLYPCPVEVVFQLCLALCPEKTMLDSPKRLHYGGSPIVVTEPMKGMSSERWGEQLKVFQIWCDEEGPKKGPRFIGVADGDPRGLWCSPGKFIFAKRPSG